MAALAAAAAASASGCASVGKAVGATKVTPDEFKVVTKAPLSMPPDYALRPPRPGEARPQELRPDAEAKAALFGQDVGVQASDGEKNLVVKAGADAVDPAIRKQIDLEAGGVVHKDQGLVSKVLSKDGAEKGAPIDAQAEAQRLEQANTVRSATGGQPVVIEKKDGKSKLPGL